MIRVAQLDIDDPNCEQEIINLISLAFRSEKVKKGYLKEYIQAASTSQPSIFLGAFEGEQMIGCNAFIANDFSFNNSSALCFQSCWSATNPQYRGQGVFFKIQERAKIVLKEKGALLIFGLPNQISRPIFTERLHFSEEELHSVRIPNIKFLRNIWINKFSEQNHILHNTLISNEPQIIELKKNLNPAIIQIKINYSLIWGKISTRRKFGYDWRVFSIGGLSINSQRDFQLLISEVFKQKCHFIEIASCKLNTNNYLFRFWKNINHSKFIFFFLNAEKDSFKNFNLMGGVSDTF
tara:strand:+ start:730 stop:1611 length:882 start_codon:yes stop_codon:yes gene_type:complete